MSTPFSASVRVRPRSDGTIAHDVRFRNEGKQSSVAFDDPEKAEKFRKVVQSVGPAEALRFLNVTSKAGTPTVDEYVDLYLATKSGIEPKTVEHYRMFMRLHVSPTLGHLPLDAVTPTTIAAWVNGMADTGSAAKSIANRHGFMAAMFAHAVDEGVIGRNPFLKTTLPKTVRREMVFLSADEFTTLLGYIPAHYQPLVYLLATTGLRWGEATALQPGDFDLEARTVRVSRAWKSAKSRGWYIGPPKTARSKRVVVLPREVIAYLRPTVEAAGEWVFVNNWGKPIRQAKFYEGAWEPARRLANGLPPFDAAKASPDRPWAARAGSIWEGREPAKKPIGKWPRVHDLRHSYVAWQLGRGVGIDVVSRNVGHESIQTTVNVYGHVSQARLLDAADAIGAELGGAMPQIER